MKTSEQFKKEIITLFEDKMICAKSFIDFVDYSEHKQYIDELSSKYNIKVEYSFTPYFSIEKIK